MASIQKRTNKDNSTSYRVEVRLKGFPPQRATFKRLTDAKRWASATESAIRERRYFKTAEASKHTFSNLTERYVSDVLPLKPLKAAKLQKSQLHWWEARLGHYSLADITPTLIAEYRDELLRGRLKNKKLRSPATVNRYLAALSHAFSIAVNEWGWLDSSPTLKVSKPKEPRGRIRFLSEESMINEVGERTRLLTACKDSHNLYLYTVVVLALSTGMRRGEIMNLRWRDIDLGNGRIRLLKTKNGEVRVVPLAGLARQLIESHSKIRPIDTDLLFPSKINRDKPQELDSAWHEALGKAQIRDFRFHDLRHSTASYLAMNGASLAEISEVLGHKTLQMVKRYAHLSEGHTASVVASMNEKIFG